MSKEYPINLTVTEMEYLVRILDPKRTKIAGNILYKLDLILDEIEIHRKGE